MKSMEERARELINPLDLGCEALRDKIVKIFIQALVDQDKITRHACIDVLYGLNRFHCSMIAQHIELVNATQVIANLNIERGPG